MKKIFGFLAIISMLGCSQSVQNDHSKDKVVEAKKECNKSVQFGDINICLPLIDGMTECYSTPIVKERADKFNYEGNSILAFYLNNETYKQVNKLDEKNVDDYFQIYVTNKLKDIKVGQSELNQMANMFDKNSLKESWNVLKEKIESNNDILSINNPILIESYSTHEQARTFVMIIKYQVNNVESVLITISNMIQINQRLIWLAYYKVYEGEESIEAAKLKNDFIISKVINENK